MFQISKILGSSGAALELDQVRETYDLYRDVVELQGGRACDEIDRGDRRRHENVDLAQRIARIRVRDRDQVSFVSIFATQCVVGQRNEVDRKPTLQSESNEDRVDRREGGGRRGHHNVDVVGHPGHAVQVDGDAADEAVGNLRVSKRTQQVPNEHTFTVARAVSRRDRQWNGGDAERIDQVRAYATGAVSSCGDCAIGRPWPRFVCDDLRRELHPRGRLDEVEAVARER